MGGGNLVTDIQIEIVNIQEATTPLEDNVYTIKYSIVPTSALNKTIEWSLYYSASGNLYTHGTIVDDGIDIIMVYMPETYRARLDLVARSTDVGNFEKKFKVFNG